MKKPLLLVGIALLIQACSGKEKEAAAPVNTIAPNTASVKVDGVLLPMSLSRTVATVYTGSSRYLGVSIGGAQGSDPVVTLILQEYAGKTGQIAFGSPSTSEVLWTQNITGGGYFSSRVCGTSDLKVEIVEVNEARKTVSGRFSATACGGAASAQQRVISEGEFNLPYTVR